MGFYKGTKTKYGFDMQEIGGMHISPDGNGWSSEPYPINNQLNAHLDKYSHTLEEEYYLILENKSSLPSRIRKYVVDNIEAMSEEIRNQR